MSEQKLKSCPFCGGNDIDSRFALIGSGEVATGCMDCGACGVPMDTEEGAVLAWNHRAPDAERDALRAEVERLKAECADYERLASVRLSEIEKFAKMLEAVERPKWISVKDRLPDMTNGYLSDEVLSLTGAGTIRNSVYHHKNNGWRGSGGLTLFNVTHWMPLPSMPAGESEAK